MKQNKKKIEKVDQFADTLQVRRIYSGDTEVNKEKQEISKVTTKNKSSKRLNLPDYERRKIGADIENTGLKIFLPEKKKSVTMGGAAEKLTVPRQLKKAQLGSEIKMISVNLPRFGRGQAVIVSNINDEYTHNSLKENRTEKLMGTFNYDQPSNVLEDAQKEIDISQNQLQKIQSILKNRYSEDNYSLQPKWKNVPLKTESKVNSKEKVLSTLTTLNKKLSDMQEKYFGSSKSNYKSIKDFPNKLSQSISDVEMDESNSDFHLQIEDKKEILKKFNLVKTQNFVSEEKGTSVYNDQKGNIASRNFGEPTEKSSILNLTESNSDCVLPHEAKNRILEKFHLSKIQKMQENIEQGSVNKFGVRLSDKGQNFSTTIPDVILRENDSYCGVNDHSKGTFAYEKYDDSSELDFIQTSRNDMDYMEDPDGIDKASLKNNFPEDDAEKFRELLLTQEERSSEKIKSRKSLSFLIPKGNDTESVHELESIDSKKPTVEDPAMNAMKSKSSETHYFDCDSKKENTSTTSTTSNKKVFYDNFSRYSGLIEKTDQGKNTAVNSVPNLSSNKFVANETMTRSDREIFDNTPLQDAVLKSDFLTKSFAIDSSGNFSESHSNQITKNKSDQFFNGGLDFKNLEAKSVKGPKMTKDMYLTLSKALSNSFYRLPSQK